MTTPSTHPGIITLMGSGELTATMVAVHKALIGRYGPQPRAVFIDTPAGFQLNADHIARKAEVYFQKRLQQNLTVASFKSAAGQAPLAAEQCYQTIGSADYLFIGPGSPTYALRQWQQSKIPALMTQRIAQGACLVAASAAALTVGRKTLPVYEIYKVGQEPHWVDGLNLLGAFGLDLAVVPHWNNAEGGNHDTRFCFMGEPRLQALESQLPETTALLGIDEHTALVIDLTAQNATIKGMGTVTLRRRGWERVFTHGDPLPLALLSGEADLRPMPTASEPKAGMHSPPPGISTDDVWPPVEALGDQVQSELAQNRIEQATHALLSLEHHIHQVYEQLQERSAEGAAREVLRNMLVQFGTRLAERPASREACLAPLVEGLLVLRARFKENKQWVDADAVRDSLAQAGINVEDTPEGVRWRME